MRVKGNEKFLFSMLDSSMRFWLSAIVADKCTSDAVLIFEATEKLAGKKPGILILGGAVNFHETWRDMWRAKNPLQSATEHRRSMNMAGEKNNNQMYSDTQKFVQNIDQHLLESITNSQKNSVFHEGFDSIIRFLNASTFYGLLTPCTNFGVWL